MVKGPAEFDVEAGFFGIGCRWWDVGCGIGMLVGSLGDPTPYGVKSEIKSCRQLPTFDELPFDIERSP